MDWQEAVQASAVGIAAREGHGGRIHRHADGRADIQCRGFWVPANAWDIEGFMDWEPVQPQATEASET